MKKNLTSDVGKFEHPLQKDKAPAGELKKSASQSQVSEKKNSSQQSRSGWGGRRAGAGAPLGNTNAVKHGERSRLAFFPLAGGEQLPPLVSMRASNLIIAGRVGELQISNPEPGSAAWRELMLLDGVMWQHTKRIARISLRMINQEVKQTKERHRNTSRENDNIC